jgi:putative ABC transport system permease protein
MLKNYFKIAVRNLLKQKGYSAINIAGLAIGMTCCLLILMFVWDELNYDRFHEKADRIYRLYLDARINNKDLLAATTCGPLALALRQELPGIEASARLRHVGNFTVRYDDKTFNEERFFFADSTLFEVFSFAMLEGEARTALTRPHSVVITDEMARKYFGDASPLGKSLLMDGREQYAVSGVVKKFPTSSHWQFDFLASMNSRDFGDGNVWISNNLYTYAVIKAGVSHEQAEATLKTITAKYVDPQIKQVLGASLAEMEASGLRYGYRFQPLTDIHLRSHLEDEIAPTGNVVYVYVFLIIAAFILLIACINFMNLSTARSARRAKEVGVRKVLGSRAAQLMQLFLGEATLLSALAMLLAVGAIEIILPTFNNFTGKNLALGNFGALLVPALILFTLFIGLLAGSYPAFVLSSFQPVKVLKGEWRSAMRSGRLRSALVILQFTISIALIVGTIVVHQQLLYVQSKSLGFDKEQVLVLDNAWLLRGEQSRSFKNALLNTNGIVSASYANTIPGKDIGNSAFLPEGGDPSKPILLWHIWTDFEFVPTMKIGLKDGRNFSSEFRTDSTHAVLINEPAAKLLGYQNPVGRKIMAFFGQNETRPVEIVGLMNDFHFESLHQPIRPLILRVTQGSATYLLLRVQGNFPEIISNVEREWASFTGGQPFVYFFLDDELQARYAAEQVVGKVFGTFSGLGIFIAALGLLGLATYATEQRTKEIGIRKVLGANVPSIVSLLSKEFVKLVVIANLVAWPVAYFAMQRWLENFAYRIELGFGTFFLAAALALLIALLTVSYNAIKAALSNPVESLRYE